MSGLPRIVLVRLLWLLPAILFLMLAIFSAVGLMAETYLVVAQHRQQSNAHSVVALSSGEVATQLAPWKSEAWQTYADLLASSQQYDAAVDAMKQALIWMPMDGAKWSALAQLQGLADGFGISYKSALTRAVELAPYVPPVRRHVAVQGAYWWRQGDPEVRHIWFDSIKASLEMDSSLFLSTVAWAHREDSLCLDLGDTLKIQQWCEFAHFVRSACLSGKKLHPNLQKYCETLGYADKVKANAR